MRLSGRQIVVGVTGGIAAYKTPDLIRRLKEAGAAVRVVMTEGAKSFITPLTLQAVSGEPVHDNVLSCIEEAAMGHISLARWADTVVVAPATANCLAKLAHGWADDLLGTLCLATEADIYLAPAMNRLMWTHRATQSNVAMLKTRGVHIIGPGVGSQACGEVGPGRMEEPDAIVEALLSAEAKAANSGEQGPLAGQKVLITAGPTREPLDPVRYISNRSSGKMGFALAAQACHLGADVTLVTGPVKQDTPWGVRRIDVETCDQMHQAVFEHADTQDIFIATAAVADYKPTQVAPGKIKKTDNPLSLAFERNPDILGEVARLNPKPFCVGFAAETAPGLDYARDKLMTKNCDLLALNYVNQPGCGFDVDTNALTVLWHNGEREIPLADKSQVAEQLWTIICERRHESTT